MISRNAIRLASVGLTGYALYIAATCPCETIYSCHLGPYLGSLLGAAGLAVYANI